MPPKILLLEDNVAIREITAELLKRDGYCVTAAANGKEGLEFFAGEKFDLIITDIFMPVMDGNDFIAALENYSEVPPILALSYNVFDIKHHPLISLIATKPMRSESLRGFVARALALSESVYNPASLMVAS